MAYILEMDFSRSDQLKAINEYENFDDVLLVLRRESNLPEVRKPFEGISDEQFETYLSVKKKINNE